MWEHDLDAGLRLLRLGVGTHLITSHHALPLLIRRPGGLVVEVTDGTAEYNGGRLPRVAFLRPREDRAEIRMASAPGARSSRRTAAPPSRADAGLDALGGDARALRRDRGRLAPRDAALAALLHRREPAVRRARGRRAGGGSRRRALENGQSLSSGGLAQVYGFTDTDGTRPDCWRGIVEVREGGLPADDTGYR